MVARHGVHKYLNLLLNFWLIEASLGIIKKNRNKW